MITRELKTVYIVTVFKDDQIEWMGVGHRLNKVYEAATFRGAIATPSLSYKQVVRHMKAGSIILWDKSRFTSEDEAKYSPVGGYVRIGGAAFIK